MPKKMSTPLTSNYSQAILLKPILVFGYPRSGTTVVGSALGSNERCLVVPEAQFLVEGINVFGSKAHNTEKMLTFIKSHYRFKLWQYKIPTKWETALPSQMTFTNLLDAFFNEYGGSNKNYEYIIEHDPQKRKFLSLLASHYPDALFIHVIRDGRAIAASTFKLPWGQQDIISIAKHWKNSVTKCEAEMKNLAPKLSKSVRYEDFVVNGTDIVTELLSPLGLELDQQKGIRTDNLKILPYTKKQHSLVGKKLDPQRITAWKNYLSKREIEIFEYIAGETLSQHGFERLYKTPKPPTALEKTTFKIKGLIRKARNRPKQLLRRYLHTHN